jgi:hypothetical protein
MKVRKRKEVVARSKAALGMRRSIGWTRGTWINEVESALGEAFIIFCQARLAHRNGQQRHAQAWEAEFERLLFRKMVEVHVHPVKREFDRGVAFDEAVAEMPGTIRALGDHVEREFGRVAGKVRRGIEDRDIEEFWKRTREAARILVS